MTVLIVGIDCATRDEKTGLALGYYDEHGARIEQVTVASRKVPAVETVAQWIGGRSAVLIALDAPLGWPTGLAQALCCHTAGGSIQVAPDDMFRRTTDKLTITMSNPFLKNAEKVHEHNSQKTGFSR